MSIGDRLFELRNYLGLTQEKLALILGISQKHISQIEKGTKEPSKQLIKLISLSYNTSEVWLETGQGEMFMPIEEFLKSQMTRFGEQAFVQAVTKIMKETVIETPSIVTNNQFSLEYKETIGFLINDIDRLTKYLDNMPEEEQIGAYTFLSAAIELLLNKDICKDDYFEYIDIINSLLMNLHKFTQVLGIVSNNKTIEIESVIKKYMRSITRRLSDLVELYGFEKTDATVGQEK